jgi:hypothetical protein
MVRLSDSFLEKNKIYSLDLRQLATVHLSGDDFRNWRRRNLYGRQGDRIGAQFAGSALAKTI